MRKAIGRGARGQVYLAHDPLLDTLVAIKLLHHCGTDEAVVRFQNEAIATGKLKHPRIAQTLDFGSADGALYMVMEFVDGESLEQLLERQTALPFSRALALFLDVCSGLNHAHANGILHRDLKPANVIVVQSDEGEFAKLVDFGIAKIQGDNQIVTDPKAIVGSPIYMSPEGCKSQECDVRSDVYSFGCLMYEALSGSPPFVGDTAFDTIQMKTTEEAPSLVSVMDISEIPDSLVSIVSTCLKRNPDERFQNAALLEKALEEIVLEEEPKVFSVPESSESKQKSAKPAVFAGLALLAFLSVAGILTKQILHDQQIVDSAQLRSLNTQSDTARFWSTGSEQVLPKVAEGGSDSVIDLADDEAKNFSLNVQKGLAAKFDKHEGNRFDSFVEDGGRERIKVVRSVRDEDFQSLIGKSYLRTLTIEHGASLTGAGMKYIEKLPLRQIFINESMMNDGAMKHFYKVTSLEWLFLHKAIKITDEGLKDIDKLKSLRSLEISSSKITDRGVDYISNLKELTRLDLSVSNSLTDECIPAIASMTKLTDLNLSMTGVTADGITNLAQSKRNLLVLSINGLPWSRQSLEALASMPKLEELKMENTDVNDEVLQALTRIKKLRVLNIDGSQLSGNSLKLLKDSPKLERLVIANAEASVELLKSVATLKLHELEFYRARRLYDFNLWRLQDMPELQFLKFGECAGDEVTLRGAKTFQDKYSQQWRRAIRVEYDPREM